MLCEIRYTRNLRLNKRKPCFRQLRFLIYEQVEEGRGQRFEMNGRSRVRDMLRVLC